MNLKSGIWCRYVSPLRNNVLLIALLNYCYYLFFEKAVKLSVFLHLKLSTSAFCFQEHYCVAYGINDAEVSWLYMILLRSKRLCPVESTSLQFCVEAKFSLLNFRAYLTVLVLKRHSSTGAFSSVGTSCTCCKLTPFVLVFLGVTFAW